ncbi:MAG: hypothetical protein RR633_10675 [Acinetobacter sp.]
MVKQIQYTKNHPYSVIIDNACQLKNLVASHLRIPPNPEPYIPQGKEGGMIENFKNNFRLLDQLYYLPCIPALGKVRSIALAREDDFKKLNRSTLTLIDGYNENKTN